MRTGAVMLFCTALFSWVLVGAGSPAWGLDVDEEAETVKDKAKDTYEKGKEKVEDVKEKVSADEFWDKVPPYLALPGALLVGLLVGFVLGRRKKKDRDR